MSAGDPHAELRGKQGRGRAEITAIERIEEIARMLGGEHISATTLAHAREMLQAPERAGAAAPRAKVRA